MAIAIDITFLTLLYATVQWIIHKWEERGGTFHAFRYLELLWASAIVVPIGYVIFFMLNNDFRDSFWQTLVLAFVCMVSLDLLAEKYPRNR